MIGESEEYELEREYMSVREIQWRVLTCVRVS